MVQASENERGTEARPTAGGTQLAARCVVEDTGIGCAGEAESTAGVLLGDNSRTGLATLRMVGVAYI